MVSVPLNIMCSKKWLMPVMPGRSFTEPTLASQPAAMVLGWSWRGTRRNFMPLGSVKSSGSTCWAMAAGARLRTAANTVASEARRMRVSVAGVSGTVPGP